MLGAEAVKLSGRSESWLRTHECALCGQTLWRALVGNCGAIYQRCEPSNKDFSDTARLE
jgi:hypothetical protein